MTFSPHLLAHANEGRKIPDSRPTEASRKNFTLEPSDLENHETKPLKYISDLVCSDRFGAIIRQLAFQSPEDQVESYRILAKDMIEKIDALDLNEIAQLSDRDKRTAILDIKLLVHGMRKIAQVSNSGGLSNPLQDKCEHILFNALSVQRPQELGQDPLDLGLQELLQNCPVKHIRGYTPEMRKDLEQALSRDVVFVLDDMRGGLYSHLHTFTTPQELPRKSGQFLRRDFSL